MTSQLHLKLELMYNDTCRTSRLEIAVKTLMIRSINLIKAKQLDYREILPHVKSSSMFKKGIENFERNFEKKRLSFIPLRRVKNCRWSNNRISLTKFAVIRIQLNIRIMVYNNVIITY